MQLEYRLSADDHVAFNTHLLRTSRVLRERQARQRVTSAALVLVVVLLLIGLVADDWVGGAVFAVVGAVAVWFSFPAISRQSFESNLRRLSADDGLGPTGRTVLLVDDEGLQDEIAGMRTVVPWSGVERVEDTETHGFVMIGTNAAIIVPRRVPGAGDLLDEVRRHVGPAVPEGTPDRS